MVGYNLLKSKWSVEVESAKSMQPANCQMTAADVAAIAMIRNNAVWIHGLRKYYLRSWTDKFGHFYACVREMTGQDRVVRRREEWRGEILRAPTFSAKFVPKTTVHLEVLDTRREVHVGVTGEQKLSVSPLHFGVQTPNLPNHNAAESSSWPPPYWPCGFPNIARPISAVLDCYKGCHPYYSYRLYC